MATHIITKNAGAAAQNFVIPLAPVGSTQLYQAGYVKITISTADAAAAAANGVSAVCQLVTQTGTTAPSPALIALPGPASAVDSVFLMSTKGEGAVSVREIGQQRAKGFSADAQGAPAGTHLVGTVQYADASDGCILTIEVE